MENSVILLVGPATYRRAAEDANWSECAVECQSYANKLGYVTAGFR